MSLPIDAAPPGHLPRAASPPWPIQPPPHGAAAHVIPVRPTDPPHGATAWVRALIAAAAAAAVGLAVATPLLLARRAKSEAAHRPRRRAKA